eukprot:753608-Hanusia_phi.AAC.1
MVENKAGDDSEPYYADFTKKDSSLPKPGTAGAEGLQEDTDAHSSCRPHLLEGREDERGSPGGRACALRPHELQGILLPLPRQPPPPYPPPHQPGDDPGGKMAGQDCAARVASLLHPLLCPLPLPWSSSSCIPPAHISRYPPFPARLSLSRQEGGRARQWRHLVVLRAAARPRHHDRRQGDGDGDGIKLDKFVTSWAGGGRSLCHLDPWLLV